MHKKETYVLFFDESGKSKIVDIGNHFLLCGLVINKDLHMALSSYMISLKNKSGISVSKNIHAFDLFENEKINGKRIKISKIDTFFERLLRLVEGSDFECFVLLIDKKPYIKKMEKASRRKNVSLGAIGKYLKRNQAHDFLYEILAKKLFLRFGNFLYAEDSVGEIVAESRRWDDHATLSAFVSATQETKFLPGTIHRKWSEQSFNRIHGLTFENKKGLSFGLELADLFAWAHLNIAFGLAHPTSSMTKKRRIEKRLARVENLLKDSLKKKKIEIMTLGKIKTVAKDRVSKFTKLLKDY